eukprot:5049156-Alexandrium_andersonii.AAC.1
MARSPVGVFNMFVLSSGACACARRGPMAALQMHIVRSLSALCCFGMLRCLVLPALPGPACLVDAQLCGLAGTV